jgi:predicted ATPase/DNA-binding SARP family transcriptional activator
MGEVTLRLSFLGAFQVTLQDQPSLHFQTNKVRALLAYLAMASDRPHERATLVGLFWPEMPKAKARNNLSKALGLLHSTLRDQDQVRPFLLVGRRLVRFNPDSDYWLDVAEFQQHVAPRAGVPQLEQAVALYRGEFLSGFALPDTPAFAGWLLLWRERLNQQMLTALTRLAAYYLEANNYEQAQRHARRQLELDAWREVAYVQLMRALALAGDRSGALAQYEQCHQLLAEELGVEPEAATKDLYEQIKAGKVRGKATPAVPRHNLPPPLSPLVGRKKELDQISRFLADPQVRLVTILGPGGIGKTRLAMEAAAAQLNAYADGVWFVSLAPIDPANFTDSSHAVITAIAGALNLALHGADTPRNQVLSHVQNKEMLLVFDSFEHLLPAADLISELLRYSPQLKAVVTSRERLNLKEEWLCFLLGLRTPAQGMAVSDLMDYGAIRLFCRLASKVQPRFDLETESAAVTSICHLVEGMPLGIELAANWARLISCQTIAEEIARQTDFLAAPLRNVPERHRSMRAVFDQSWRLLSKAEKTALQRLSVFRGGFQREAAEAVADAPLQLLSALVDKSLLRVNWSTRYEIHELLRQYAAEKLHETPDAYEQTRALHGQLYLDLLRQQEEPQQTAALTASLDVILTDIDNVRSAWRWAVRNDQLPELRQAAFSLWHFYETKGWYLEALDAFRLAVNHLRQSCTGLPVPAANTTTPTNQICLVLGVMLTFQAWFETRLGRYEESLALFRESLAILRPTGRQALPETGLALIFYAVVHCMSGTAQQAIPALEESIILFRQVDWPWGHGTAVSMLGQAHMFLGHNAEAEPFLEEAITILSGIGNRSELPYALSALAHIAQMRGDYGKAEAVYRQCLDIRREIGDQPGMAYNLYDLGEIARLQGAFTEAEAYYKDGLAICETISFSMIKADCLRGLGNLAEGQGDFVAAKRYFQDCLATSHLSGLYPHSPSAMTGLGWAALGLGENQEAEEHFYEALKLEASTQRQSLTLDALAGLAHYMARVGESQRALELLTLTLHHPAVTQETRDRATSLWTSLTTEPSVSTMPAAQAKETETTLEHIVSEMLRE